MDIIADIASKVNCVITDPPYGIDYQSNRRKKEERFEKIQNDSSINGNVWVGAVKNVMADNSAMFMFTRWDVEHEWIEILKTQGFNVKSEIVWYKPGGGIGDLYAQFMPQHENAIFSILGQWKFPSKRPGSVYVFSHDLAMTYEHPSQKPVPLMERIVLDITAKSDTVLDPFMGSGSTGIACIKHGRRFIGVEIDSKYFDIACRKISAASKQPLLL